MLVFLKTKTKQNKTKKQNKQNKTKQKNKTKQNKTKQNKTKQSKNKKTKTKQNKIKQKHDGFIIHVRTDQCYLLMKIVIVIAGHYTKNYAEINATLSSCDLSSR